MKDSGQANCGTLLIFTSVIDCLRLVGVRVLKLVGGQAGAAAGEE
jgi:hypothetical protein